MTPTNLCSETTGNLSQSRYLPMFLAILSYALYTGPSTNAIIAD